MKIWISLAFIFFASLKFSEALKCYQCVEVAGSLENEFSNCITEGPPKALTGRKTEVTCKLGEKCGQLRVIQEGLRVVQEQRGCVLSSALECPRRVLKAEGVPCFGGNAAVEKNVTEECKGGSSEKEETPGKEETAEKKEAPKRRKRAAAKGKEAPKKERELADNEMFENCVCETDLCNDGNGRGGYGTAPKIGVGMEVTGVLGILALWMIN